MAGSILVLNAGSSSLKFGLFEAGTLRRMVVGGFEDIQGTPRLTARDENNALVADRSVPQEKPPVETLLRELFGCLEPWLADIPLAAVGHRIVHGGSRFVAPVSLSEAVVRDLDALTPIAPLHQPACLEPVQALMRSRPGLPQVGCFDTAFHYTLAPPASRYALPRAFEEQGIRRYGFHGLSYEFIAGRLREISPETFGKRTVVAHLGSGCSLCAMREGKSLDTTMGFTALEGLPMGTRPGRLDAGVVLWMMEQGMSHDDIEHVLYHDCGMKGLSGISNDMRELLASDAPSARLALKYFAWRVAEGMIGLGCAMNGIDGIVFTAGVGENSAEIRQAISEHWGWLGIKLDPERNAHHGPRISSDDSRIGVYVVRTNEELIIAQHTLALVKQR